MNSRFVCLSFGKNLKGRDLPPLPHKRNLSICKIYRVLIFVRISTSTVSVRETRTRKNVKTGPFLRFLAPRGVVFPARLPSPTCKNRISSDLKNGLSLVLRPHGPRESLFVSPVTCHLREIARALRLHNNTTACTKTAKPAPLQFIAKQTKKLGGTVYNEDRTNIKN